jgi:hypothetical protein
MPLFRRATEPDPADDPNAREELVDLAGDGA